MILVIDALNRDRFQSVLDDMFELRARVFHDRLGWDVQVKDGKEIDMFDELDPAYLVVLDEDYNVVGCNRMLQTTGPHMLTDVFDDILDGEPPLRSATVWENTRFCIDTEPGLSDVISVVDPAMDRILKRCDNAPYGYLGKTVQVGKTKALAALSDITEERLSRIRAFAGITGDIFADEDEVAEALENAEVAKSCLSTETSEATPQDLHSYCNEQIAAATTEEEKIAALRLKAALAEKIEAQAKSSA